MSVRSELRGSNVRAGWMRRYMRHVLDRSDVHYRWHVHDERTRAVLAIGADRHMPVGSNVRERIVLRRPLRFDVLHDGFDVHSR
jgi:hypothetical protein